MINILLGICLVLLVISGMGYFLIVLREKYYLKNNIIIVDHDSVTMEDFEDIDMTVMAYRGLKLKTGDEIKITTEKESFNGILIGGKFKEGILKMVTDDEVKEFKVKSIDKIKLVREYGRFFTP